MSEIIREITKRIEEMPKVSEAPYRLLKTISKQDYNIQEVVDTVETDVTLTTQCLRIVNSAAYSFSREISSIRHAVVLLGSQTLAKIAIGLAFKNVFSTSMTGYAAKSTDFWEHSVRTALASRIIATHLGKGTPPDLAYTAGLLHDIGKAIISQFLERYKKDLHEKVVNKNIEDFIEIERSILGTDHATVGEAMAVKWKFPEQLRQVIKYHHCPSQQDEEHRLLVSIVHMADLLAMMGGTGTGLDSMAYSIDPEIQSYLNLGKDLITKLIFEIDMEFINTKNKLNIFAGEEK